MADEFEYGTAALIKDHEMVISASCTQVGQRRIGYWQLERAASRSG